jgi:hypothetical protein
MMYILYAYLAGAMLVMLWISVIRYVLVDTTNPDYSVDQWMLTCVLSAVLWPIVLIFTRDHLFQGRDLFRKKDDLLTGLTQRHNQRMAELEAMAEFPPPCARQILYRHAYSYEENGPITEIRFQAADIEKHFKGKDLPLNTHVEKAAIVAWIRNRDEALDEITAIPNQINFENMAINLIEGCIGEIVCTACHTWYPAGLLVQRRPELHDGWNMETYHCPVGHELIKHNWIHVFMKRKKPEK